MTASTAIDPHATLERVLGAPIASTEGEKTYDWHGVSIHASIRGTGIGRTLLSLSTELASFETVSETIPITKLLEHAASSPCARFVIRSGSVWIESGLVVSELESESADDAVRWRAAEIFSLASAWRQRLGLTEHRERESLTSLADLKDRVRLEPDLALLVAAVAFGVAGADGVISDHEREQLRAWLSRVPTFEGLETSRVVKAIASLAEDPARTLMESSRRLDPRGRLLAWALANEMAHADGFASDDERRYLSNIASVYKLGPAEIAPLAAEAQRCAIERETLEPAPPSGMRR